MIKVGIHAGVMLVSGQANDKGTLAIVMKKVAAQKSRLAILNSSATDELSNQDEDGQFLIFPVSSTDWQKQPKTADVIFSEIVAQKDMLNKILQGYYKEDDIKWDIFKGVSITDANFDSQIVKDEIIKAIYDNIVEQFSGYVAKLGAKKNKQFRLKLVRRSKKSHFPVFPKYGEFWESMEVPAEQSQIAYTKSEIKGGFDSPDQVEEVSDEISEEEKKAQLEALKTTFNFGGSDAAEVVG
jgi:hypothetical protein